jgi:hypothetical protein
MASSKPIDKMLYLTLDANFGKQQAAIVRNVVLYSKEKCISRLKYTEKVCNNKIVFSLETEMSPLEFSQFASKKINRVNHRLLYGLWNDSSSAAILFYNLADLTDQQSWENRSWVFDTETDIFVSNSEADCLTRHELDKEDLLIF